MITLQGEIVFRNSMRACDYEQKILEHFREFTPDNSPKILKSGNTEIRTVNMFEIMGRPKYVKDLDNYFKSLKC